MSFLGEVTLAVSLERVRRRMSFLGVHESQITHIEKDISYKCRKKISQVELHHFLAKNACRVVIHAGVPASRPVRTTSCNGPCSVMNHYNHLTKNDTRHQCAEIQLFEKGLF